ncbi:MAG: hypothetical protein L7G94_06545 [Acidilobus sp.]|nr:hypothetical protein [Acidilobus sp.]
MEAAANSCPTQIIHYQGSKGSH